MTFLSFGFRVKQTPKNCYLLEKRFIVLPRHLYSDPCILGKRVGRAPKQVLSFLSPLSPSYPAQRRGES